MAELNAFRRYNSSLENCYGGLVESSHLYLHNRFVHFAHAKYLADEFDMLKVKKWLVPPDWPYSFADVYEFVKVSSGEVRVILIDAVETLLPLPTLRPISLVEKFI